MSKTKSRKKTAVDAAKPPAVHPALSAAPATTATEVAEKIKELVLLAKEQGHLTFNDISEALPEQQSTPEQLDEVLAKLRELEIEIVDPAE
ncbi:MAG TPA: RNA polymerase sigma factor region1.1 domain-containing protein, partial [Verrucomicrobiae bacterium]